MSRPRLAADGPVGRRRVGAARRGGREAGAGKVANGLPSSAAQRRSASPPRAPIVVECRKGSSPPRAAPPHRAAARAPQPGPGSRPAARVRAVSSSFSSSSTRRAPRARRPPQPLPLPVASAAPPRARSPHLPAFNSSPRRPSAASPQQGCASVTASASCCSASTPRSSAPVSCGWPAPPHSPAHRPRPARREAGWQCGGVDVASPGVAGRARASGTWVQRGQGRQEGDRPKAAWRPASNAASSRGSRTRQDPSAHEGAAHRLGVRLEPLLLRSSSDIDSISCASPSSCTVERSAQLLRLRVALAQRRAESGGVNAPSHERAGARRLRLVHTDRQPRRQLRLPVAARRPVAPRRVMLGQLRRLERPTISKNRASAQGTPQLPVHRGCHHRRCRRRADGPVRDGRRGRARHQLAAECWICAVDAAPPR